MQLNWTDFISCTYLVLLFFIVAAALPRNQSLTVLQTGNTHEKIVFVSEILNNKQKTKDEESRSKKPVCSADNAVQLQGQAAQWEAGPPKKASKEWKPCMAKARTGHITKSPNSSGQVPQ